MKYLFSVIFCLSVLSVNAQDLYDLETIQTIEITFAESNWDALLDAQKAGDEDYILAQSVAINGEVYDSVGVKYKGNSTYDSRQVKNPWHIELDTYKEHDHQGYTDIKLSNVAKDPSFLREVLSYEVLRNYMDAPLSNYANVYVNGDLIGLYSNSESVSKKFANKYFGSKKNTYVKCNPPDGAGQGTTDLPSLEYLGEDSTAYYDAYELKSDYGWDELIDLCDTLENHIDAIEQILDVDRALWMLAFNNVLVNLDSYLGQFTQNYYLYRDNSGRFLPVVWDLNESFGQFSATGTIQLRSTTDKQQMTPFLHENDDQFPLVTQLLSVPMYRRMYIAHCKTMLQENFENGRYFDVAQTFQTLIDSDVQADPNKFFTYANFTTNITNDITSGGGPRASSTPGITNLMDGRSDYLLALDEFNSTEPSISNPVESNSTPTVGDMITITTEVSDAETIYLGYRTNKEAIFNRVLMYDDGMHEDGAAGDGTYGVEIEAQETFIQYYIYAENDDAGKFSPIRAEHEYHELSVTPLSVDSDIVINEFMASNELTVTDQDGEYDDWVELYNLSSEDIDLSGYSLSDDSEELAQWQFPEGTIIEGNGYLIIWADKDADQEGLHAEMKLSSDGEEIYLSNSDGEILDQVVFPAQEADISYGRLPNGTGNFTTMTPTFNAENMNIVAADSDIVINEFMASNELTQADQDGEFDDWVELYNLSDEAIDLSGYALSDDSEVLDQWTFPDGTIIEANGYLIIWADEDLDQDGLHAAMKLSAGGEEIYLSNSEGVVLDQVVFPAQETDISYGRLPNGTGDFTIMTPTFNAENMNIVVIDADIVINEFMASNELTVTDQDGEYDDWVELYNLSDEAVDLSGYSLSDDSQALDQWQFPDGTTIEANGYLIIWADGDLDQDGLHADMKLSAGGEEIYLSNADGEILDQVIFPEQETDISYGRLPNGTGDFTIMTPTFNAVNMMLVSSEDVNLTQADILVAPNPASDFFQLNLVNINEEIEATIYSINGTTIYSGVIQTSTIIDATNWPAGMYTLRARDIIKKIIIQ